MQRALIRSGQEHRMSDRTEPPIHPTTGRDLHERFQSASASASALRSMRLSGISYRTRCRAWHAAVGITNSVVAPKRRVVARATLSCRRAFVYTLRFTDPFRLSLAVAARFGKEGETDGWARVARVRDGDPWRYPSDNTWEKMTRLCTGRKVRGPG